MRIGVVVPELMGHMNPAIELVRELCALGHEAMLVTRADGRARAERLGVKHARYGWSDSLEAERAELGQHTGLRSVRAASEFMRRANAELMGGLGKTVFLEQLDALIVDEMLQGACLVAARRGMPYATICTALSMAYDPAIPPPIFDWQPRAGWLGRVRDFLGWSVLSWFTRRARKELEAYRKRHRIPLHDERGNPVYLGRIQVAQQPEGFDFPRAWSAPYIPTGAWVTRDMEDVPFPWDAIRGRALTYISLGTIADSDRGREAVRAAARRAPFMHRVVVAGAVEKVYWGTIERKWAPHYALIQRADAVITNGGLNTTLACLAAGKVPVILPQAFEQPGIAARVRALQAKLGTPRKCAEECAPTLSPPPSP